MSNQVEVDFSDLTNGHFIRYEKDAPSIIQLDGNFTIQQLQRIINRMRSHLPKEDASKLLWAIKVGERPAEFSITSKQAAYTILREHGYDDLAHNIVADML